MAIVSHHCFYVLSTYMLRQSAKQFQGVREFVLVRPGTCISLQGKTKQKRLVDHAFCSLGNWVSRGKRKEKEREVAVHYDYAYESCASQGQTRARASPNWMLCLVDGFVVTPPPPPPGSFSSFFLSFFCQNEHERNNNITHTTGQHSRALTKQKNSSFFFVLYSLTRLEVTTFPNNTHAGRERGRTLFQLTAALIVDDSWGSNF